MAKRGHGEGSIYQRKDGRWAASITLENHRRKTYYGKTRREVQEKLKVALHEQQQGTLATGMHPLPPLYWSFATYISNLLQCLHTGLHSLTMSRLSYGGSALPKRSAHVVVTFHACRLYVLPMHKHTWISERAIKRGYPQNTSGIVLPHLPDGALELDEDAEVKMADGEKVLFQRGSRLGVEVERRRKDFRRLDQILPDLLEHYSGVWYFCQPKVADAVLTTKLRLVQAGILTKAQAKLIRVLDLEEEE